jgi:hypothetical protein
MSYNNQFSTTTEETLKKLPRSLSAEIFDRVKQTKKKNFFFVLYFI